MRSFARISRFTLHASRRRCPIQARSMGTAAVAEKKEGDISDAFASLSGQSFEPLDPRFADLKGRLIKGHEDELCASWDRLLHRLRDEVALVAELGPKAVPEIDFADLDNPSETFQAEHRKRGVAVIRNVCDRDEALQFKKDIQTYVAENPHTKAFPPENPQVYELYWSSSQLRARAHPNVLKTQRFLMSFWHSKDTASPISVAHPASYADRLRIRQPGDAKFALGPHVDGGSVERWEEGGYGLGHVYDKIFQGKWEEYDAFEASCRLAVLSDLYQGIGACSMFRMYQGWLSMSQTGPFEGTLMVNPLLGLATAYYLLRPFFSPKRQLESSSFSNQVNSQPSAQVDSGFLHPTNWSLTNPPDSWLHGATPGRGQELRPWLHPHLLPQSMVHIPTVEPGDYVAWHCDTIHAVDNIHAGQNDSSVLYIPACPLTEANAHYLKRQRDAFIAGRPGPDFPGGEGESSHVGRITAEQMAQWGSEEGLRAFGLQAFNSEEPGLSQGQTDVLNRTNKILGFYD